MKVFLKDHLCNWITKRITFNKQFIIFINEKGNKLSFARSLIIKRTEEDEEESEFLAHKEFLLLSSIDVKIIRK